jgi:acetyl esterase/lipase
MIRLSFIVLFLLIALLAVFKAPTYYAWLLAIAVTEYSLVFIVITLLLLCTGFWPQKFQLVGTIIGVVALGLFLSPIVRAYKVAEGLNQGLTATFGPDTSKTDGISNKLPFNFLMLFSNTDTVGFKTLTYVKYADTALTLDFYPSKVAGKRPCVIVVHGGSWSNGDSKQLPELNSYLARAGYNVAAVNYRMAPKYQSPAPVQDIQAALNYLRQSLDSARVDKNNFVLLGRSAGAQIALLAAYTLHDKDLKGVIDFYGPADMVWGYSVPAPPRVMDSRAVMRNYLGGPYEKVPQNYVASSPIQFVDKQAVPTLIIHGQNDVLVAYEHSRRLEAKLDSNDIKHFWLKLPWATHGFDYNLYGPGGQLSTYAVERFLHAVTTVPAPAH